MTLLLLACATPEPGAVEPPAEDSAPDSAPEALVFAGIHSLAWDGAEGLVATWEAPLGPGELTVEVVLEQGGEELDRVASEGLEQRFSGLAPGEYRVRVEATDGLGRRAGEERTLAQLVGPNRLVYRSEVPLPGAADVWGLGSTVVLAGRDSDVSFVVVDASRVQAPSVLHVEYGGGYVKDAKIGDGLLFTNAECGCELDSPLWQVYDKVGARIWDFADPAEPVLLAEIGAPSQSVHNLSYGEGFLYLSDNNSRGVHTWDVRDPQQPVFVGEWLPPGGQVHDLAWVDGRLYVAWWAGFAVLDVSDPLEPVQELLYVRDGPAAVHNVWPSADGSHVLTTDERVAGDLRLYDVRDPEAVEEVARFRLDPAHSVHNVHVQGDLAFLSAYLDGVQVLDISDPAEPVVVGWYDSFDEEAQGGPGPLQIYDGAWGVWPFGEHVAVGDMRRGLILLDLVPALVTAE